MTTTIRIKNNLPRLQQFLTDDSSSILKAGAFLESQIAEKISSGKIQPPLTAKTIELKGSSSTLVDTGELLGQVTTRQDVAAKGKSVDVGVFGSRALIAYVHEFGKDITVTPAMRNYLHRIGIHLKATTTFIHIPERSFMRSTANEKKDAIAEVFGANLKMVIEKATIK